jgi:hypothetical protein
MVECPGSCNSFTSPHTASWFKIHEDGLAGTQKLIKSGNSLTVKIPASLKPGNYLIRHELIVSKGRKRVILQDSTHKSVELGQASGRILS